MAIPTGDPIRLVPHESDLAWMPWFPPGATPSVVGFRVDADGWFVALRFTPTATGVLDLTAFVIEWHGTASTEATPGYERARRVAQESSSTAPPSGLTSRRIRTAASYSGLIDRARRELGTLMGGSDALRDVYGVGRVAGRTRTDAPARPELARFVLEYDELRRSGVETPRQVLAGRHQISEAAVKDRLGRARRAGLYATTGRGGKAGNPTPLAYELAKEDS